MIVAEGEAESNITSYKTYKPGGNYLIVIAEFSLKFTLNIGFQLFLDVLLNFAP